MTVYLGCAVEREAGYFIQEGSLAIVVLGELSLAVVVEDPSDDRYLECAVEGEAGYVVSGNRHLVRLAQYEGVEILSPSAFLDVLS